MAVESLDDTMYVLTNLCWRKMRRFKKSHICFLTAAIICIGLYMLIQRAYVDSTELVRPWSGAGDKRRGHFTDDLCRQNNSCGTGIVEQGLYWGREVEALVPRGLYVAEQRQWVAKIRQQKIQILQDGKSRKCGARNAFIVTEDGSWLCGRHKSFDVILGEVLAFYLSQLLGIDSVPAVVLSELNETHLQWQDVDFRNRSWESGKLVSLIQWIEKLDLTKSNIKLPLLILEAYRNQKPLTADMDVKSNRCCSDAAMLLQWGNLILFDYLTGQPDSYNTYVTILHVVGLIEDVRLAYMQARAYQLNDQKEIERNVRNLYQDPDAHKIWFFDNEGAFTLSYAQVYGPPLDENRNFVKLHQKMLKTMCIFDRKVAENVRKLARKDKPHEYLEQYARNNEPLLGKDNNQRSHMYQLFMKKFPERLNDVKDWIDHCAGTASN